ncbi:MAG: HEPN domain-containing protein [Euryarchaeota archaeon]|nr:HEPN domain-containing protein [Euryarchaeota archaeon]MDP3103844.1 HEPN domain-containing protein [Candidatus Methanoperedens sp.]
MKKSDFFNRLQEEGKLQLVPPSEEIMTSYLKKSDSHLISAKLLLENDRLEESVSLAYYSMYYMLLSLFFRVGIKCENHSAGIILLKELFSIDNSLISYAKKERIDKQYYVDFKIMKEEVEELIEAAEIFNSKILDFIEKLNSEKIAEFRMKMENLLKPV